MASTEVKESNLNALKLLQSRTAFSKTSYYGKKKKSRRTVLIRKKHGYCIVWATIASEVFCGFFALGKEHFKVE